jgi:hypothetical protein
VWVAAGDHESLSGVGFSALCVVVSTVEAG